MAAYERNDLDVTFHEASLALANSTENQPSKWERRLNTAGDSVAKANDKANNPYAETTSKVFSFLKDRVSEFESHSKVLMSALDEVGKLHPFIGVAIVPFKIAINLELKRRENDDKVRALHATMSDVMETLLLLKRLASPDAPGPDGRSIEARMRERLVDIGITIKTASKLCDTYQKRHLTVKVFTSHKWQGKFGSVIEQFVEHQRSLQSDLQMHASLGISLANDSLATLDTKVDKLVEMMFTVMRSPEEREMTDFIVNKGGEAAILKNDVLLKEMLAKQKTSKDDSLSKSSQIAVTAKDIRMEVKMEVDQIVVNNKLFDQKFDEQRRQLEEVKTLVKRESDRVIEAVLSGPHDRIVNRDIYQIWKDMNWKSSVKAKHLVMALNDHFAEQTRAGRTNGLLSPRASAFETMEDNSSNIISAASSNVDDDDVWAIRFITVQRVQPLIEALDDDVSSFVTVSEINAFTSAAPEDWSLPRWIAYWTYGFELTCQWYFRRIRKVLLEFYNASHLALPANRKMINSFSNSSAVRFVEDILAGLANVSLYDNINWDSDNMFLRFKDYVVAEEEELEKRMRGVTYYIEDTSTLELISGGARPEKHLLPLLYLLLKRSLRILTNQAVTTVLHPRELEVIEYSISTISGTVNDRVQVLQDVWRLQNLNEKEQIRKFFYGLYSNVTEEHQSSSYWARSLESDMHSVLDITEIPVSDEPGLWYPVQQETLEIFEFSPIPADDSETSLRHILVSHWGGEYTFDTTRGIRLVYLNITSVDSDGTILGAGTDVYGRFKILGKVDGDQVNFVKEYLLLFQGEITKWACEASLSEELDCMKGVWRAVDDHDPAPSTSLSADPTLEEGNTIAVTNGLDIEVPNPSNNGQPEDDGTSQTFNDTADGTGDQRNDIPACGPADGLVAAAIDDGHSSAPVDNDRECVDDDAVSVAETESIVGGAFKLMRRPVEWFLCQPPVDESDKKSPKSLWKFAIAATRHQVQSRSPHWSYIQIRRRQRHRFMELRRRWNSEGNWNAVEERDWLDLVRTVHAEDRALWKAMMEFKDRRDAVHSGWTCDGCHKFLDTTRVFCVTCWEKTADANHSIDLCFDCCRDQKEFSIRDNLFHSSDHLMVQLRRHRIRSYLFSRLAFVRSLLSWATEQLPSSSLATTADSCDDTSKDTDAGSLAPHCIVDGCKTDAIKSGPCWACMDCKYACFVCVQCNAQAEKERPWLFERHPNQDFETIHDWAHALVYIPGPSSSASSGAMTIEERIGRLEVKLGEVSSTTSARLDVLEAGMMDRLQRLETMIERLLMANGSAA